jgi:hypothetical protein
MDASVGRDKAHEPPGAVPAVRWVNATYRGFPPMINVVCYCGCEYSFTDDMGRCPRCGEHVFLTGESES